MKYFRLSNIWPTWFIVICLFLSNDIIYVFYSKTLGSFNNEEENGDSIINLLLYLALGYLLIHILKRLLLLFNTNSSSKNLYIFMIKSLIQAKVQYFDRNPSGRILIRFSTDIGNSNFLTNFFISSECLHFKCYFLLVFFLIYEFYEQVVLTMI